MKILYFGTVCNSTDYEKMLAGCRIKPSAAPFAFETALMQGFSDHGADVEVFSFPAIPSFPKNKRIFIKPLKSPLDCGYSSTWIPSLNITCLKQLGRWLSSHRMLKKWLEENWSEKKAVIIYSIYHPVAKSIISLCKKTGTPCFAMVPDLPRDMFSNEKISFFKRFISRIYVRAAENLQCKFNGYIYFTKYMKDVINPSAPYIVCEGIAEDFFSSPEVKSDGRTIMYAGALNKKMGVDVLLDAFSSIPDQNIKLWLFGSGDYVSQIKTAAKKDARIKFFGQKPRNEILNSLQQAHLLVNLRNAGEEYTKYSFPSKIIEYMVSGTPVLTTKLPGIPDEYFDYCFTVDELSANEIAKKILEIFSVPEEKLKVFGAKARGFVLENKNSYVQSEKILKFIKRSANYEHET